MARGITEQDVHTAADDIVTLGERPTVERIRAHLGTGSPNTVTRWLDTWWMTVGARLRRRAVEDAAPGVPEPVARLAHRLWQAALQTAGEHAASQLIADRGNLEARERAVADDLGAMTRAVEVAHERQQEAEGQASAALAAGELLTAQVTQLTHQVQDVLRQRDSAYARGERLEQELDAMRRSQGEASAAHEEERRALQTHIRAVEDRAHAEVDRHRLSLRSAKQEWGQERTALTVTLREVEQQATAATTREQQALRRLEGLVARADGLEAQLTSLKEANGRLAEALRHTAPSAPKVPQEGKQRRTLKQRRSSTPPSPATDIGDR